VAAQRHVLYLGNIFSIFTFFYLFKGTPLYMAPEVMLQEEYDEKADVYRYMGYYHFVGFL